MSSLPEEIYLDILMRLPVKSLCACKCVCRSWFSIISNPSFVKSHLDITIQNNNFNLMLKGVDETWNQEVRDHEVKVVFYSISHDSIPSLLSSEKEFLEYAVELDCPFKSSSYDSDSIHLLGFCDGLVCLSFDEKERLYLWNPATKEYKKIPRSPFSDIMFDCRMIGLGYDRMSEDYKLVACMTRGFLEVSSAFEVYSLRSNSWERIGNVPYKFEAEPEVGVLLNRDRLHWLAETQNRSQVVVYLDVGDLIFKEIQLPNEILVIKDETDVDMELGVLQGCLCVHIVVCEIYSEIWVMQGHGVQESWTKRHRIDHERNLHDLPLPSLMWSFESGELLFGLHHSDVGIHDPKDGSVRESNIPYSTQVEKHGCYYESLISLGSGTYVGGEEEDEDEDEDEDDDDEDEEEEDEDDDGEDE